MKLHVFATSHFCDKARWVLDYKGISYETIVAGFRSPGHLALRKRTGRSTVPVLQTDDGQWVRDSTRIALFLEARRPEPRLLPEDPDLANTVRVWDDWADDALAKALYPLYVDAVAGDDTLRRRAYDASLGQGPLGRLYPVLSGVFETRYRKGAGAAGAKVAHAVERTGELFEVLAGRVTRHPYLVGDRFTLADLSVATMLSVVDRPAGVGSHAVLPAGFRVASLPKGAATDAVLAWHARIVAEHRGACA